MGQYNLLAAVQFYYATTQVGKHRIETKGKSKLRLYVHPNTSTEKRLLVINDWYREQLKVRIIELLEHWTPLIKRTPNAYGIRIMKTKWGSCNIEAKRIWLNLELVKKPPECLEYILVHELSTFAGAAPQ